MVIGEIVVNLRMDGSQFTASGNNAIAMAGAIEQACTRAGASIDGVTQNVRAALAGIAQLNQQAAAALNSAAARPAPASAPAGAAPAALGVAGPAAPAAPAGANPAQAAGAAAAATQAVGAAATQAGAAVQSVVQQIQALINRTGQVSRNATKQAGSVAAEATKQVGKVANEALNALLGTSGRIVLAVGRIGTAAVVAAGNMGKQTITALGRISSAMVKAASEAGRATIRGVGGMFSELVKQVGNAAKAVGGATRNMSKGVQDMNTALRGTTASAAPAGDSLGRFAIKAAIAAAALMAVRKVFGALTAGASMVADTERAVTAFSVLAGSQQHGAELYKRIQKFALDTSFTIDDVTKATQGLLAAGIAPGSITKTLEMLGNLAMGDTNKLGFLSKALSDVKNKGKLAGQEIRQFAENGVGIVNALAMLKFGDATAASTAKIIEMSEAGEISYGDVTAALTALTTGQGRFAGMLGEQAKTIGGMWGILTENLTVMLRDLTAELFKAFNVKSMLRTAISWVEEFQGAIKKVGPLAQAVAKVFNGWVLVFGLVAVAAVAMWMGILGPITAIPLLALAAAIAIYKYFGLSFSQIVEWVTWAMDVMTWAFNNIGPIAMLAGDIISLAFLTAWEDIKFMFGTNLPEVLVWFSTNFKTIFTDIGSFVLTFSENFVHNIGVGIQKAVVMFGEFAIRAKTALAIAQINATTASPEAKQAAITALNWAKDIALKANETQNKVGEYRSLTEGMTAPQTPALKLSKRPRTDAEKEAEASIGDQAAKLKDSYDQFMAKGKKPPVPEVKLNEDDAAAPGEPKGGKKTHAGAMERGSKEAYSTIVKAMGGGDVQDKMLTKLTEQEKHMKRVVEVLSMPPNSSATQAIMQNNFLMTGDRFSSPSVDK